MRYVHLPPAAVDIPLLEDATRRGMFLILNDPLAFFACHVLMGLRRATVSHVLLIVPCFTEAANQASKAK